MKSWIFLAALLMPPLAPAFAQPKCETITDGVEFCSDAHRRNPGFGAAQYPDHVASYRLQRGPLVSANIIVMPLDRTLTSGSDIVQMIFDQISRGTPAFTRYVDLQTRAGSIDGRPTVQIDFGARDDRDRLRGAFIIDALPGQDAVLMFFTKQEGEARQSNGRPGATIGAVTDIHRAVHAAALADFRIGR